MHVSVHVKLKRTFLLLSRRNMRLLLNALCVTAAAGLLAGRPAPVRGSVVPRMQLPQPWDAGRAFKTALFYNGPAQVLDRFGLGPPKPSRPDGLVWSAERPELAQWGQLDDVVRQMCRSERRHTLLSGYTHLRTGDGRRVHLDLRRPRRRRNLQRHRDDGQQRRVCRLPHAAAHAATASELLRWPAAARARRRAGAAALVDFRPNVGYFNLRRL